MRARHSRVDFNNEFVDKGICNVGAAAIGAAVVGGVASYAGSKSAASTQADAANQASQAQLAATNNSNQLQWTMYQQNLANQSPYMQAGGLGLAALEGALFGGTNSQTGNNTAPSVNNGAGNGNGMTTQPVNTGMATTQNVQNTTATQSGVGGAMATPGGGSGQVASNGITYAPNSTGQLVPTTASPSAGTTGITAPTTGSSTPYTSAGVTNYGASQSQLNAASNAFSGQLGHQFGASDLTGNLAPNYQFQLNQGEQALKASMAATGQLQTGQGLKNINDYAQNSASSAYQNAFNNYNTNQNNLYNRLQGLISPGSSAATSAGAAGTAAGAGIANTTQAGTAASNNYLTSGAAANAAGTVGGYNALGGAISSGLTGYVNSQNTGNPYASQGFNGNNTTGYTYQNPSSVGPQLPNN